MSRRRTRKLISQIYQGVSAAAREPRLYGPGKFLDNVDGRFECLSAHASIAAASLREKGGAAEAGLFVEIMFEDLDSALRELGVGDHSIARRVRGLGERFVGRGAAYEEALNSGVEEALVAALSRNLAESHELDPSALRCLAKRLSKLKKRLDAAELADWPTALGGSLG